MSSLNLNSYNSRNNNKIYQICSISSRFQEVGKKGFGHLGVKFFFFKLSSLIVWIL